MKNSTLHAVLLLAALVVVSACARGSARSSAAFAPSPDDGPRALWCPEQPVLVLENFSGGKVEVIEVGLDSGVPVVIATRATGRHTIPIRGEHGYRYGVRPVQETPVPGMPDRLRTQDGGVSFKRECRSGDS